MGRVLESAVAEDLSLSLLGSSSLAQGVPDLSFADPETGAIPVDGTVFGKLASRSLGGEPIQSQGDSVLLSLHHLLDERLNGVQAMPVIPGNDGGVLPSWLETLGLPERLEQIDPGLSGFSQLFAEFMQRSGKSPANMNAKDVKDFLKQLNPDFALLFDNRPDVTVEEAIYLWKTAGSAFHEAVVLLIQQPSLKPRDVADMLKLMATAFGREAEKAAVDSAFKILRARPDINPLELGKMYVSIGRTAKSDTEARLMVELSQKLLIQRNDITPAEVSKLFETISKTVKNDELRGAVLEKSVDALLKRADLRPDDLGNLIKQVASLFARFGDEVAGLAILTALDILTARSDVQPSEILSFFGQIARSAKSADEAKLMLALGKKVMSQRDDIKPDELGQLFEQASEGTQNGEMRQMSLTGAVNALISRRDLRPSQMGSLIREIGTVFGRFGPSVAGVAVKSAMDLLESRKDVQPAELLVLFRTIAQAAQSPEEAILMITMGTEVLTERRKLRPLQVERVFQGTAQALGGSRDRGSRVLAISEAARALQENAGRQAAA